MSYHRRAILCAAFLGLVAAPAAAITPVSKDDDLLKTPPDAMAKLERLRAESKFRAEADSGYTGVHDPVQRARAEAVINRLIVTVEDEPPTASLGSSSSHAYVCGTDILSTEPRPASVKHGASAPRFLRTPIHDRGREFRAAATSSSAVAASIAPTRLARITPWASMA